ncbi:FAD-dependent oxidoreductase [Streptomyces sp. NPDC101191]|uniref:FAD-dependent oxidoreductase n=1 Tax=Streptomyces sp. NPDC101191 TaxID=3366126 RepID=UPI00380F049C
MAPRRTRRGGYAALAPPGTTDGYFPMPAQPVGALHWAGTETASEHAGYVEGAIESGERAAREVTRACGTPRSEDTESAPRPRQGFARDAQRKRQVSAPAPGPSAGSPGPRARPGGRRRTP